MQTDIDQETQKATQAIIRARTNLVMMEPFFGTLAIRLKLKADPSCQTAWTEGTHIGFNPTWINTLTPHEVRGLICHEVLHVSNGHPWRRGHRDHDDPMHKKWNHACDHAINPIIKEAKHELPPGGLFDKQFAGLSAEAIYNKLPDIPSGGLPTDEVRDAPNPEEHAQQQAEWQVAVRQAAQVAKMRGRLPASLERLVEELTRPKIDWKSELRRFVQQAARNDYTWRRPNSRYVHAGLYLPSLYSEEMPPMVVAVDTSGSIGQEELRTFASEITAIAQECRPSHIHVLYIDAKVQKVDEFETGDVIEIKPKGGGGTDFRPAFDWIAENQVEAACLIYLTDMYGDFPPEAPDYPVLWVSTSDHHAPFGETLRLEIDR